MMRPGLDAIPRLLVGVAIIAAHVIALMLVRGSGSPVPQGARDVLFISLGQVFVQVEAMDRIPSPQLRLQAVSVDASLREIRFEETVDEELGQISGAVSAPQLARFQSVDVSAYARRAGVSSAHPLTVVLAVRVLEDGRAGSVDVSRSSGNAAADAAAVDYALGLQWIPGTRDRRPQSMRVLLPVILSLAS